MKKFKRSAFLILILGLTSLYGNGSIITDNRANPKMFNTLGAVNIYNLSGHSTTGFSVCNFRVVSLPNAEAGVLYMKDGVTPVVVGQHLNHNEADAIKFDPKKGFVGTAKFTYRAMDVNGIEGTIGTSTFDIIAPKSTTVVASTGNIVTDNKLNPEMLNTLGPVNILDLSGKDGNGVLVNSFQIKLLPDTKSGTLYMEDGTTLVTANQIVSRDEASNIKFDPKENFVGNATFTYTAIDANDESGNVATVTIPVVGVKGAKSPDNNTSKDCVCEDYTDGIPVFSTKGLIVMILLSSTFGLFFTRRELLK